MVKAHILFHVPVRSIADHFDVSHTTVVRAVKAFKDDREPGVNGKPRYFSKEEEKEIEVYLLKETEQKKSVRASELVQLVHVHSAFRLPFLYDYVTDNVSHLLSNQIEEWVHQMNVRDALAGKLAKDDSCKRRPLGISIGWVLSFVNRTPSLKLAPSREVEQERVENSTKEEIDSWFAKLVEKLNEWKYDPSMIANFDETFLVWGCNKWKVITKSTNKVGIVTEMKTDEHTTLCATIFGDGSYLSALLIIPRVFLPEEINYKSFPSFDWTGQKNGWIDKDIFDCYCREVLIPEFKRRRKLLPADKRRGLLILDGHSTRQNASLVKAFAEAEIDVAILPAHTSHITQPLDVCFFAIFKRRLVPLIDFKHASTTAERRLALLKSARLAFQSAACTYYIEKSFSRAGIIPLNSSKLLESDCVLTTPKAEIISPDAPKKKRSNLFRISNSILTDKLEELELIEEERAAAATTPKKRQQDANESQAPVPKRPKKSASAPQVEYEEPEEEDEFACLVPKECSCCDRSPSVPNKKWTKCPICKDQWVCSLHPMGLTDHYTEHHPDDEVPGRSRRSKLSRYRNEWMMDDDDE